MSLPSRVQPLMIQWTMPQPVIGMAPKSGGRPTSNLVWHSSSATLCSTAALECVLGRNRRNSGCVAHVDRLAVKQMSAPCRTPWEDPDAAYAAQAASAIPVVPQEILAKKAKAAAKLYQEKVRILYSA